MHNNKLRNKIKFTSLILTLVLILSAFNFAFAEETKKVEKDTNYLDHKSALVFLTDFGVKDGAVSAMKGVSL